MFMSERVTRWWMLKWTKCPCKYWEAEKMLRLHELNGATQTAMTEEAGGTANCQPRFSTLPHIHTLVTNASCSDGFLWVLSLSAFVWLELTSKMCMWHWASWKPKVKRHLVYCLHFYASAKEEHAPSPLLQLTGPRRKMRETWSRATPADSPTRDQERQASCWTPLRS